MAVRITKPKRVFRHNGFDDPDPAPSLSSERAVELLSATAPALTNAVVEPGVPEDGKIVHILKTAIGSKG